MRKPTPNQVAKAIAQADSMAGYKLDAVLGNSIAVRAKRMVARGYIVQGDPGGWSRHGVVTIHLERKGGTDDCEVPIDFYGEFRPGGATVAPCTRACRAHPLTVAADASESLNGHYIAFVNAGVAMVYKD